jgi:hypothetical protein
MTERFIASKARLVSRQHGEWRVQYGQIRRAAHGYKPTREAATAAFAKSWRRESLTLRRRLRLAAPSHCERPLPQSSQGAGDAATPFAPA